MAWDVYEFLDARGERAIAKWIKFEKIQKEARIKLDHKVDLLKQYGPGLPGEAISQGPINGGSIYKLKIKGKVQLRPLLCKGPFNLNAEYTLLHGAIERNSVLPKKDIESAEENRLALLADRGRRSPYESCN